MEAVIAGVLLATLTVGFPVQQPVDSCSLPAPALTLRQAAARANIAAAPRALAQRTQTRRSRFSKIERAIAIGAGTVIGFYTGAVVGWHATANHSNPNDDTSGLRGVVIGAPMGAVAGAVLATVWTR